VNEKHHELTRLLEVICNSVELDSVQAVRLNKLLLDDADARSYYWDYLEVHLAIKTHANRKNIVQSTLSDARLALPFASSRPQHSAVSQSKKWILAPWPVELKYGVAALLLVLASASIYLVSNRKSHEIRARISSPARNSASTVMDAADSLKAPAEKQSTPLQPSFYLAQIGGVTSDVHWGEASKAHEFLLRIRRGDRLDIRSGLVEVNYYSGANLILHGPCVFIPTGPYSGRLEQGRLLGRVADGDFTLHTPTAEVIDLGTEFGVTLDPAKNTDVCVFDGEVRVSNVASSAKQYDSRLLKEGGAVRVSNSEGITDLPKVDATHFSRSLPASPLAEDQISLVEIFGGMHGGRFRLAGVVAPDTGESDRHPWLRPNGPGHSASNGYQTTGWHPFIDGVFIPSRDGEGTQLDSSNHQADLPPSAGVTWGPIWSRRRAAGVTAADSKEDYWGTDTLGVVCRRLESCRTGMIGLHSNVGITFDLLAMERAWGKNPVAFEGIVCNLENSQERDASLVASKQRLSADLRVFVDGELRESHLDFARSDGDLSLSVDLDVRDRFLTIVSSDAGDVDEGVLYGHAAYDHVVLIDPVLLLAP